MNIVKSTPLGIYEKALPGLPDWYATFGLIAECGYDFLELSVDESEERIERLYWGRQQKKAFSDASIATETPVLSMCLSAHRKYPLGSDSAAVRQKGLDLLARAIQLSVDTGIRVIQLAGYDVYYEAGNEKTRQLYEDSMNQALTWAGKANVTLAIENMDHPFLNSVTKIMQYVERYQSPMLQVYPDIGNLTAWKFNVREELKQGASHIVGIHVKDTVEQVFRRIDFGQGTVDFSQAFKALHDMNYQGPFVIEMWSDHAADSKGKIIRAREWVQARLKQAGYTVAERRN
ncbi:L-ribulose-5-phosphate 3-epimerase [Propionispora hippei]|uniref:L-ribulose-5-phosphate 3-epimerase n=1 Tax=Propionispora hippei DSM 15287 TaxID=1123003 RepID=A0A1M6L9C7_9FIRM|nr:L-ribulose-5-phosphate 3-epimerase [Propionispora hippei]SHJ67810.1 L-ribulose-5-phosphate 3-epimerase [Propionispora hippei DSM 15287]